MNDDLINPNWDERTFVVSPKGQELIDEVKSLWVDGVSLGEIAVYLKQDAVEITLLLALENLVNHLKG